MSLNRGRKLKNFLAAFIICGAFLFILGPKNALAIHSTSTYEKPFNGTLSATEWNNLLYDSGGNIFGDFVNTWLPAKMNGPLGIATSSPNDSGVQLDVNGYVRATGFIGPMTGLVPAQNVTPGEFGFFNFGGGDFSFGATQPGNVGIGVAVPQSKFHLAGNKIADYAQIDTGINLTNVTQPPSTTAVVQNASGNIDAGTHRYLISYVTPLGETDAHSLSPVYTFDASHGQAIVNLPVSSDYRVTGRKIYRDTSSDYNFRLVATINNNTDTTYLDNISDASRTGLSAWYNENKTNSQFKLNGGTLLFAGIYNTIFGYRAGNAVLGSTGSINTFIGGSAGINNTTGTQNTFVGYGSGSGVTTTGGNTALGSMAGYGLTGANNTFVGNYSGGTASLTGGQNVIVGAQTAYNLAGGTANTFLGYAAGYSSTGNNNVFLGYTAGRFETGGNKIILDNLDRGTEAQGRTSALIYGITNNAPANQILSLGGGGSVGIGTTTPAAPLDVNGLIKMRTATITADEDVVNKGYFDSALALATSTIITQVATSSFWQGSLTSNVWNANSGNVGVGTTDPQRTLDVNGFIRQGTGGYSSYTGNVFSGEIRFYNGTTNTGGLYPSGSVFYVRSGSGDLSFQAPTNTDRLYISQASGNIGIGTTTPQAKLEVVGTVLLPTAATIQIGSAWNTGTLDFKNGATTAVKIDVPNNKIQNNLSKYYTAASAVGQFGTQDNYGLALVTNSIERLRVDTTGNVGIGTTAPNDTFSIGNSGTAPAGSSATGHNYTSTYLNSDDYALANYGIVKTLISSATSGAALWGGSTGGNIWNLNSAYNVGIGITNPETTLHLSKSVAGGAGPALYLDNTAASTLGNSSDILFSTWSGEAGVSPGAKISLVNTAAGSGANAFTFYTKNTSGVVSEKVRFDSQGNVGIGTTTPTFKLDISGGIATNDILNLQGPDPRIAFKDGSSASSWYLQAVNNNRLRMSYGGAEFLSITQGGNVGIGTTNPTQQLQLSVPGSVGSNGIQFLRTGGYGDASILLGYGTSESIDGGSSALTLSSGSSKINLQNKWYSDGSMSRIRFYTMAPHTNNVFQDRMVINEYGNVGVGTTAPNDTFSIGNSGTAPAGSSATGHNYTSTYLNSDDYALANYGIVKTLISSATSSSALWGGTTGGVMWSLNGANNIGVGIAAPRAKLDVVGTSTKLRIASDTQNAGDVGLELSHSAYAGTSEVKTAILATPNGGYGRADLHFILDSAGDSAGYTLGADTKMVIKNTGNVGIGTTNPGNKLDVIGKAYFSDHVGIGITPHANWAMLIKGPYAWSALDSVGAATFELYSDQRKMRLLSGTKIEGYNQDLILGTNNNTDSVTIQQNTGNVGIGTTVPDDIFSIGNAGSAPAGSSNTGHNFTSTYLSSDDYALTNYGVVKTLIGAATSGAALWGGNITGNIWSLNGVNNVGIGTMSPASKLDVVGNTAISGVLSVPTINGSSVSNFYGPINAIAWNLTAPATFVNNNAVAPDFTNTAATLNLTAGNGSHWDLYNSLSGLTSGASYTVTLYVKLGTATNFALVVNDTTSWNTIGGRVFTAADGLSSSAWKQISYTFTEPAGRTNANLHVGANMETALNGAPQTLGTVYIWGVQVVKNNSSTLVLQSATGNVGIGMTNPGYTLDVVGTSNVSSYSRAAYFVTPGQMVFGNNTGMYQSAQQLGKYSFGSVTAQGAFPLSMYSGDATRTDGYLNFFTAGIERLRVNGAGNVGIGTTAPNDTFSIGNATAAAPAGSDKTGHNFTSTYLSSDDYALTNYGVVKTLIGTATSGAALWGGNIAGSVWSLNGANNVGIGTTNPQVKLDVSGVLASGMGVGNGEIRSYQSPLILPSDYGNYVSLKTSAGKSGIFRSNTDFFVYYDTNTGSTNIVSTINSQPIIFKYQSTELARFTSSGNLGIGTTAPNDSLSIGLAGSAAPAGSDGTGHNYTSTYLSADDYALTNVGYVNSLIAAATSSIDNAWVKGGNNVLAIENFGTKNTYPIPFITNNIERMRLTDNGNFVIGATSTAVRLHVESPQGPVAFFSSRLNGGTYAGYLGNGQTYSGEEFGLYYALNDARLAVYDVSTASLIYGNGIFINNNSNNVGIGTIYANDNFSIGNGGNSAPAGSDSTGHNYTSTYLSSDDYALVNYGVVKTLIDTATSSSGWLKGGNNVTQTETLGTLTNHPIPFIVNNSEVMRLQTNGSVSIGGGVGTTVRLHVETPQGAVALFTSKLNGGLYSGYLGNGATFSGEEFGLYDALSDTRLAAYDYQNSLLLYGGGIAINNSSNNVGIGMTNPLASLHVASKAALDPSPGGPYTFNPTNETGKTGNIQKFFVPKTGTYLIRAWGAQGGGAYAYSTEGGKGARITGNVYLTQGELILILVGQKGGDGESDGMGGGGTFVVRESDNSPIMIAGGGGGASQNTNGMDGVAGTTSSADSSGTCAGVAGPNGGDACSDASGGGGFVGDGGAGSGNFQGISYLNGGTGGWSNYGVYGGFGGGGGTDGGGWGGGGGGGYAGGSANTFPNGGGGGSSYNSGSNQANSSGIRTGAGLVIISWVDQTIGGGISAIFDGNVGIGATAPNDLLSIGNGGNAAPAGSDSTGHNYTSTYLSSDDYALVNYGVVKTLIETSTSTAGWLRGGNNVSQTETFGTLTNHPIPFLVNNSEVMRLQANGSVSIGGGTSTTVRLHVETSQGPVALFTSKLNGGLYSGYLGNGATFSGEEFGLYDSLSDTRLAAYDYQNSLLMYGSGITINNSSNNVGIGTTAPNDSFSIGDSSGTAAPAGSDRTGHNYTSTYLSSDDYALTNYGLVKTLIGAATSSSALWGGTSISDVWNLNSGNVGIGLTNPTALLDVNGTVQALSFNGPLNGAVGANNVTAGVFGENYMGGTYSFGGLPTLLGGGSSNNVYYASTGSHIIDAPQLFIRQDDAENTLLNTKIALDIHNDNGGQNTYSTLAFSSREQAGAGNPVALAGISGWKISAGTSNAWSQGGLKLWTKNNGTITEAMTINHLGNVGIGTTNPIEKLQIASGNLLFNKAYGIIWGDSNDMIRIDDRPAWLNRTNVLTSRIYSDGLDGSGAFVFGRTTGTTVTPIMTILSEGNVGIGTTNPGAFKLKVVGDVAITGALLTQTGSDFAEEFKAPVALEPGTVVVMGDEGYKSVKASENSYDKTVVGIVSDNPSIIAGRTDIDNKNPEKVIVAMMGVVKVKVTDANGKITKGDLLTTSDLKGYAMRAKNNKQGTVIGKALEDLNTKTGEIKVLVNLQ